MPLSAKERLILIRVKIKRAEKHLVEFDAEAAKFRATYSHVVGPKKNPETGRRSIDILNPVKVRVASFNLLAIAGDVIQNLRSALDHLANQLVEVGSPGGEPSRTVAFPICASANKYESAKVKKLQGMRPDAVRKIDALKPYKGGNDTLWKLHSLSNIDKHKTLFTVGDDYLMQGAGFDGEFWVKTDDPLFDGILASEMHKNAQLAAAETLGEAQVAERDALLPTLHQLFEFVDNLVGDFEPLLE
jgi:hypothetical protein